MKKISFLLCLTLLACKKDDEIDPTIFNPIGKVFIYTEIKIDSGDWEPDEDPNVLYFVNPVVFYEGFLTGQTGSQGKQEVEWFQPQSYELTENSLTVFDGNGSAIVEVSVSLIEAGLWLFEFESEGPDESLSFYQIKVEERSNTEFTLP